MKYTKKVLSILSVLFFTYSCNYKPLLLNDLSSYDIIEVKTTGEKRIGHKIKNQIKTSSSNQGTPLLLEMDIKKNKSISEKNIKNKITKYQIRLIVDVSIINLENSDRKKFSVVKSGEYASKSRHSTNLQNEKNLINILINDLSSEILKEIFLQLSDI